MPLFRKRSFVRCIFQADENTYQALTTSAPGFFVSDANYKLEPTIGERNIVGPSFARKQHQVLDRSMSRMTFRTEMTGQGSDPKIAPAWATLLKACGFSETVSTTPARTEWYPATNPPFQADGANGGGTLSMYFYRDGNAYVMRASRGSWRMTGEIGQPIFMDWDFSGTYYNSTIQNYASMLSDTFPYDDTTPPILLNATFSFHGYAYRVHSFSIDCGNTVVMKRRLEYTAGLACARIIDRNITGSFTGEGVLYNQFQPISRLNSGTAGALAITCGTAVGNSFSIGSGANMVQITSLDTGERDNISTQTINFAINDTDVPTQSYFYIYQT